MGTKDSIFLSAGDVSADFPGKTVIDQIKRTFPDMEIDGLGGPLMQAAGLMPLADHRKLAVLGFWEIVPRILFFRGLLNRSVALIEKKRPAAVILLDYPGFNLRLAARVKKLGIPIIYFIAPQVWAWGKGRIKIIRELVDLMLVVFPFEEKFFVEHGVPARFVGHPVVDRYRDFMSKDEARRAVGCPEGKKCIALLPGSRTQEIQRMLPAMAQAAGIIRKKVPSAVFYVAGVDNVERRVYDEIGNADGLSLVIGRTPELLCGSDFVITSSGTATIEAALFRTPMVIIYKTGFLSYQIARRLVKLEAIGMVNIIAGRHIVPELIQNEASPEKIAEAALAILHDEERYHRMVADLQVVRDQLGPGDVGRLAGEAIREKIQTAR